MSVLGVVWFPAASLAPESRRRMNASNPAGTAIDTASSATRRARETRRESGSGDERVDGNGDEHQHEVHVRPDEEPDRALGGRVAFQRERASDEQRAEHEYGGSVELTDITGERERER